MSGEIAFLDTGDDGSIAFKGSCTGEIAFHDCDDDTGDAAVAFRAGQWLVAARDSTSVSFYFGSLSYAPSGGSSAGSGSSDGSSGTGSDDTNTADSGTTDDGTSDGEDNSDGASSIDVRGKSSFNMGGGVGSPNSPSSHR